MIESDTLGAAGAGSPVEVRWIPMTFRQFGVDHTMRVAELADERVDSGIVALGIGGSEEASATFRWKSASPATWLPA
jgi:hypothetical protein